MQTGIMLKSLFVNNSAQKFFIHVIVDDTVSEDLKRKLRKIVIAEYGNSITFYNADAIDFDGYLNLGSHTHVSKATYYRLFMAEFLPKDIAKVLYLDGDMVVMNSILDLWNVDISDCAIAGVAEHEIDVIQNYNRLQYSRELGMFNAGVLLINLDYWRKYNLQQKFIDFTREHPERVKWHDQDVLNFVLREKKKSLPLKYNVQPGFFYKREFMGMSWERYGEEIETARKKPVILHFSTYSKPWYANCSHPMTKVFLKYKNMTEWKDIPLQVKYKPNRKLRYICGDILRLLRLRKPVIEESSSFFETN